MLSFLLVTGFVPWQRLRRPEVQVPQSIEGPSADGVGTLHLAVFELAEAQLRVAGTQSLSGGFTSY